MNQRENKGNAGTIEVNFKTRNDQTESVKVHKYQKEANVELNFEIDVDMIKSFEDINNCKLTDIILLGDNGAVRRVRFD